MEHRAISLPAYVIKVEDLAVLKFLAVGHPEPVETEWINRGTDQKLKSSTVEMLLRTLNNEALSPSAVRLHRSTGLRMSFRTEPERASFAKAFEAARANEDGEQLHLVTAIFDDREHAEKAVSELREAGIPEASISLLWRASQLLDTKLESPAGHSTLSIANAVAGGGVAGAMLGVALLMIPGIGPVAAAGAIAASAFASVGAVSAAIGAAGGAIARMLTDHDVDGVSAAYYEEQIRRGRIFVSVNANIAERESTFIRQKMSQAGGRLHSHS